MMNHRSDRIKDLIIIDRQNGDELADLFTSKAVIKRVINGEFNIKFTAPKQELKTEYLRNNTVLADNQLFDIVLVEKRHNKSGSIVFDCQATHVTWRLFDESTTTVHYGYYGTLSEILANILQGTEFSVGIVDYNEPMDFVMNINATTGQKVLELVKRLNAEIDYSNNGFTIDIRKAIGNENGFEIRLGKNIKEITEVWDIREGQPLLTYVVDILALKNSSVYIEKGLSDLEVIEIGDVVYLIDEDMEIDTTQRIMSIEYDPRYEKNTKLEIGNVIKDFVNMVIDIETESVNRNKTYYGIKLNNSIGFEVERLDKLARTQMNADKFAMQKGDGAGNYENSLYFDPIQQKYIFIGRLEATEIVGGTIKIGNNFAVDENGNMVAIDGTFKGKITGGTINISNKFEVDEQGNVTIKSGSINIADKFSVDSNGNITIKSGSINIADKFVVDNQGNMTAINGTFKGIIEGSTINGGEINGSTINTEQSANIGKALTLNNTTIGNGIFWGDTNGIKIYVDAPANTMFFRTQNNFRFESDNGGDMYINGKRILTEDDL